MQQQQPERIHEVQDEGFNVFSFAKITCQHQAILYFVRGSRKKDPKQFLRKLRDTRLTCVQYDSPLDRAITARFLNASVLRQNWVISNDVNDLLSLFHCPESLLLGKFHHFLVCLLALVKPREVCEYIRVRSYDVSRIHCVDDFFWVICD